MPRGGFRVGAGRKKKPGVVIGMDGQRRAETPLLPPAITDPEKTGLAEPPKDQPADVQACWRELAPKALEERTLTPSTAPGFLELCIRAANVKALDVQIQKMGNGSRDALPYMKERRGQAHQLATSLKDFKLEPFGKPATSDKPKPAANPWGLLGAAAQ